MTSRIFSLAKFAALSITLAVLAKAQPIVEVSPEASTVAPGSNVTINISIRNVTDLHMASVVVSFDNSILEFQSSSSGTFLKSNAQGYSVFYYEKLLPLSNPDTVRVDQAILGAAAVNGSGDLFAITFKALREGTSPVKIEKLELRNSPNYVIDGSTVPGTIVVGTSNNRSPVISSTPPEQGIVGQEYSYQTVAQDPDGDPLSYRLLDGPPFLTIDPSTGRLSGTPDRTGKYLVIVRASDGKGGTATQTIHLSVFKTDHPPSEPRQSWPANGSTVRSLNDTLRWTASIDPRPGDQVRYAVHLVSAKIDTVFGNIADTTLVIGTPLLEDSRLYSWTVKATDGIDTVATVQAFTFTIITTGVGTVESVPASIELGANYPNPFSRQSTLTLQLATATTVWIDLVDLHGREVASISRGDLYSRGAHFLTLDAAELPTGVYMLRARSAHAMAQRVVVIGR